jgi:hypothetical protein
MKWMFIAVICLVISVFVSCSPPAQSCTFLTSASTELNGGAVTSQMCSEVEGLTGDQSNAYKKRCDTAFAGFADAGFIAPSQATSKWKAEPCTRQNAEGVCTTSNSGGYRESSVYYRSPGAVSLPDGGSTYALLCTLVSGTWESVPAP